MVDDRGAQPSENPRDSTDQTDEGTSGWLFRLKGHAPLFSAIGGLVGLVGLLLLGAYDYIVIPIQGLGIQSAILAEQSGSMNEKLEDLDQDVAAVEADLQSDFDELTKSIHGIDVRLTAVETRLGDVGERLSEVSAEVRTLGNEVRKHEHRSAMHPELRNTAWSEGEFVQP